MPYTPALEQINCVSLISYSLSKTITDASFNSYYVKILRFRVGRVHTSQAVTWIQRNRQHEELTGLKDIKIKQPGIMKNFLFFRLKFVYVLSF